MKVDRPSTYDSLGGERGHRHASAIQRAAASRTTSTNVVFKRDLVVLKRPCGYHSPRPAPRSMHCHCIQIINREIKYSIVHMGSR